MNDLAISVTGLRKSYGPTEILHGIDLGVHRGETLAVLGPNGAGKTTTVEILLGLLPRDDGEVRVLDADPAKADRAHRARVGIVAQYANDLLELTVDEALRHFARYYPNPRDPRRVIEDVGLAQQAGKRVRQLSGGQRRRLDVAVGIIGSPELLLMDEPTTGFDPEARQQFWELTRELARQGTTILLTTHYLDEAEALADRVAIIDDGRIAAVGPVASLVDPETVTVTWDDGVKRTTRPAALVTELSESYGGEVPGLTVTRESLADVYTRIIDEEAAA
ncbi:MAG: ABC transporter ATP-binding protein [Stackebrandtia sp.]